MTRVCLLGAEDVELRYELVSHETSREALSTYDLAEPFENAVALETVSLGAAVSLLNDLNWYIVRYVEDALVLEPSISDAEWLSRDLARAIRDDEIDPADSDRYLKVYGVLDPDGQAEGRGAQAEASVGPTPVAESSDDVADGSDDPSATADDQPAADVRERSDTQPRDRPRLVEPMYLARTGRELPAYDLRDVDDTLRVRVTEAEFGA